MEIEVEKSPNFDELVVPKLLALLEVDEDAKAQHFSAQLEHIGMHCTHCLSRSHASLVSHVTIAPSLVSR